MICDEAQKIKTPGAMVTHAAKAQNARFKIACTGTPVENHLADYPTGGTDDLITFEPR
jgi:SNF2 family DNA or RNA helicase